MMAILMMMALIMISIRFLFLAGLVLILWKVMRPLYGRLVLIKLGIGWVSGTPLTRLLRLQTTFNFVAQTTAASVRHLKLSGIDPLQKWLPLNDSFVHIQNSLTDLVFETKILKNLLSRAWLVRLF